MNMMNKVFLMSYVQIVIHQYYKTIYLIEEVNSRFDNAKL